VTVKAAILDLHGTLVDESEGVPVEGVPDMLSRLKENGLAIAIATNRAAGVKALIKAGLSPDIVITKHVVGKRKGSPVWVDYALDELGVDRNEIVWLGDSSLDMRSAVNARILYFNAGWSKPDYPYGITVGTPQEFDLIIRECFMKDIYWHWELEDVDHAGRPVTAKAMIDGRGAGLFKLKYDLIGILKMGMSGRKVGSISLAQFIMLHLIGSIYGDDLHTTADLWTIYPGSRGGPNTAMAPYVEEFSKILRDRYVGELLIRHTNSIDSGTSRAKGRVIDFWNQANTVMLNPDFESRISGKSVVVVDDFTTEGYSLDCARNLLYQAGAASVVGVVVGKYPRDYHIYAPSDNYEWNPFCPTEHDRRKFQLKLEAGDYDEGALEYIRESYDRVKSATI